jgi:hypothetical protein
MVDQHWPDATGKVTGARQAHVDHSISLELFIHQFHDHISPVDYTSLPNLYISAGHGTSGLVCTGRGGKGNGACANKGI